MYSILRCCANSEVTYCQDNVLLHGVGTGCFAGFNSVFYSFKESLYPLNWYCFLILAHCYVCTFLFSACLGCLKLLYVCMWSSLLPSLAHKRIHSHIVSSPTAWVSRLEIAWFFTSFGRRSFESFAVTSPVAWNSLSRDDFSGSHSLNFQAVADSSGGVAGGCTPVGIKFFSVSRLFQYKRHTVHCVHLQ